MNYLVKNLKFLRDRGNLSQGELAQKLSIENSLYQHWEHARSLPETKYLKLISDLFEVSIDYLVRRDLQDVDIDLMTNNYNKIQQKINP